MIRIGAGRMALAAMAVAGALASGGASAAYEGDSTGVRSLSDGALGNPGGAQMPTQCLSKPAIKTVSTACPAGSAGTIEYSSSYSCPSGVEPGQYGDPAVVAYSCLSTGGAVIPVSGAESSCSGAGSVFQTDGNSTPYMDVVTIRKTVSGWDAKLVRSGVLRQDWTPVAGSGGTSITGGTIAASAGTFVYTASFGGMGSTQATCGAALP